jgi:hypothetical protein
MVRQGVAAGQHLLVFSLMPPRPIGNWLPDFGGRVVRPEQIGVAEIERLLGQ